MRAQAADTTSMIARIRRRLRCESGFGLIELLMTLVILSISIAGLLTIFLGSAYSLSRTGRQGTATVIMDRVYEYYRRGPWADIRLLKNGPGGSWGVEDANVTSDPVYTTQCVSCPAGASSVLVDNNDSATAPGPDPPKGDWYGSTANPPAANNTATCNVAQGTGDPDTDSTAPITNCLAEATVFGADNHPYRVYTYMKYACVAGTSGGSCTPDYATKIVTVIVRQLNANLGVADTSAAGILAKQTVVFSYGSFTTLKTP
jgi:prepilin-type N-terminal cleavage/methylation domain-containing protein